MEYWSGNGQSAFRSDVWLTRPSHQGRLGFFEIPRVQPYLCDMGGLIASRAKLGAGGGEYCLQDVTLGIFLNDQPGHRFSHGTSRSEHKPLTRHQGWILPAGSEGVCEYDAPLEFVSVSLSGAVLDELGLATDQAFQPVLGEIDPLLLSMGLSAETFGAGGTLYRETMHRALAAQVVQIVQPLPEWSRGIDDARLRRVLDYIHDNLAEDLTLNAMAELAAMSPTHFSKSFKAATDRSPLQYVISARLDHASVLLRSSSFPVAEIAWRVGYQDLSRFGQHFKRKFGVTPAQFRRN